MKNNISVIPFIILLIGTFGLLINEFIFNWGTILTLIFAVINIIGLFLLGIAYFNVKNR